MDVEAKFFAKRAHPEKNANGYYKACDGNAPSDHCDVLQGKHCLRKQATIGNVSRKFKTLVIRLAAEVPYWQKFR